MYLLKKNKKEGGDSTLFFLYRKVRFNIFLTLRTHKLNVRSFILYSNLKQKNYERTNRRKNIRFITSSIFSNHDIRVFYSFIV